MRRTRRRQPAATGDPLPRVVLRPDPAGGMHVTVNGHAAPDSIPTGEVGRLLSTVADRALRPLRVEVHHPDGTVHADILSPPVTPPPQSPQTLHSRGAETHRPLFVVVTGDRFLPGEPVHLAHVLATHHADARGHLSVRLAPDPGPVADTAILMVGATSGAMTMHRP